LGDWIVGLFDWVDVVKGAGVFVMGTKWIDILLIVFGLFMAYQIILYLFGGSWTMDTITLGLQFVIITILWVLSFEVVKNGFRIKGIDRKFDGHVRWHKSREGAR